MMSKSHIFGSFKAFAAMMAVLAMMLFSFNVSGQDTKEQEAKRARLEKEIENLDIQIRENAKKSNSAIANVALLGKKINVRKELINDADKQISDFAVQINEKQRSEERRV